MKTVRSQFGRLAAGAALAAMLVAPGLHAQTTTMPSTLRWGSGLMDIPVASVLPHLAIQGTYSGFFVDIPRTVLTDASGQAVDFGPGVDEYYQDGSVTMGLFDRVEVSASLQQFAGEDEAQAGDIWGLGGRLQLLQPSNQGIGVALGGQWLHAPQFASTEGGFEEQPTRLGFSDPRFGEDYVGLSEDVNTILTVYGVASAFFRGWDGGFLPRHDVTLNLGYGTGTFQDGDQLPFYRFADSDGFFFGSSLHFGLGESSMLTFMGEYNGFDVNLGTQLDLGGIRLGAHYLASNYDEPTGGYWSEYRSPKFGLLASLAFCPGEGLCPARLMDRPEPQVVQMPAPAPDTVRVTREVAPPLPDGTPATICLATGENVQVRVTAQGDTLVGPSRVSIRTLRPGVVFAGSYAEGRPWFVNDQPVVFENRNYDKSGNEVRMDCPDLMRVGEFMGVPLFARRNAERPFDMLYVPVRPGIWQPYQAGLQRTRGD